MKKEWGGERWVTVGGTEVRRAEGQAISCTLAKANSLTPNSLQITKI